MLKQRLLVNIRGCNGAGKSTIPMSMMDDPDMGVVEVKVEGKPKKIAMVFPKYGWVALGTYFNKTGGMDIFPNNAFTKKALFYVLKKYPEYDVLMEGVIASTIKSTYANLFDEIQEVFPGICPIVLSIIPPLEVCLERIQERNGGKPINEKAVESKWKTVSRNVAWFDDQGFISIQVNSAKIAKNRMLPAFLRTVERYRLY